MFFSILKLLILFGLIVGILLFIRKTFVDRRNAKAARDALQDAEYTYEQAKDKLLDAEEQLEEETADAEKKLEDSEDLREEVEKVKKHIH